MGPECIQEDEKGATLIGHQLQGLEFLKYLEMSESAFTKPEPFILLLNLVSLQWAK